MSITVAKSKDKQIEVIRFYNGCYEIYVNGKSKNKQITYDDVIKYLMLSIDNLMYVMENTLEDPICNSCGHDINLDYSLFCEHCR